MGRTRQRVTVLVLSLEAMGFAILALAVYLAGELHLDCHRASGEVTCHASARRFFGLVTFEDRSYGRVIGVEIESPALGRFEHWLMLETTHGRERVLAGSFRRTTGDVERLRGFLDGQGESDRLTLTRSAAPLAVGTAIFACLWILIISLIMREFLGYHTPWWWRALGRRRR